MKPQKILPLFLKIFLTLALIAYLAIFFWKGFQHIPWVLANPWYHAVALLTGLIPIFLLAYFIKKQILNSSFDPNVTMEPVDVQDYPNLDWQKISEETDTVMALGYQWLGDFRAVSTIKAPRGLARIFLNPEQDTILEIHQMESSPEYQNTLPPSTFQVKTSATTTFKNHWYLNTSNHTPDPATWMLRSPQRIWTCHPELSTTEILQKHTENRRKLASHISLPILSITNVDTYMEGLREQMRERKALLKKRNIFLALRDYDHFLTQPVLEWWGKANPK